MEINHWLMIFPLKPSISKGFPSGPPRLITGGHILGEAWPSWLLASMAKAQVYMFRNRTNCKYSTLHYSTSHSLYIIYICYIYIHLCIYIHLYIHLYIYILHVYIYIYYNILQYITLHYITVHYYVYIYDITLFNIILYHHMFYIVLLCTILYYYVLLQLISNIISVLLLCTHYIQTLLWLCTINHVHIKHDLYHVLLWFHYIKHYISWNHHPSAISVPHTAERRCSVCSRCGTASGRSRSLSVLWNEPSTGNMWKYESDITGIYQYI